MTALFKGEEEASGLRCSFPLQCFKFAVFEGSSCQWLERFDSALCSVPLTHFIARQRFRAVLSKRHIGHPQSLDCALCVCFDSLPW
jgi:hypothetical protein